MSQLANPNFAPGAMGPNRFDGGFIWAVGFQLAAPAPRDCWIIQEVAVRDEGTNAGSSAVRTWSAHYWEAWLVPAGSRVPDSIYAQTLNEFIASQGGTSPGPGGAGSFNDFFFRSFPSGTQGRRTMKAAAAVYDNALPPSFVVNNPATSAGILPSTITRPRFWTGTGTFRFLRFVFDYRTSRTMADATLHAAFAASGTVNLTADPPESTLMPR